MWEAFFLQRSDKENPMFPTKKWIDKKIRSYKPAWKSMLLNNLITNVQEICFSIIYSQCEMCKNQQFGKNTTLDKITQHALMASNLDCIYTIVLDVRSILFTKKR
jgi:hypothetical protein